jgi:hypothetical protein
MFFLLIYLFIFLIAIFEPLLIIEPVNSCQPFYKFNNTINPNDNIKYREWITDVEALKKNQNKWRKEKLEQKKDLNSKEIPKQDTGCRYPASSIRQ